jgi:hypothetical protein
MCISPPTPPALFLPASSQQTFSAKGALGMILGGTRDTDPDDPSDLLRTALAEVKKASRCTLSGADAGTAECRLAHA